MKRFGQMIRLKPDGAKAYVHHHTAVWPSVLVTIKTCNIRNYSIYLKDDLLFGYFEYTGVDYAADMAKMAADPSTLAWWQRTDPCQEGLSTREPGEWWAKMDEVFHTD